MKPGPSGQLLLGYASLDAEDADAVAKQPAPVARGMHCRLVQAAPRLRARQTMRLQTSSHMPITPHDIPDEVAVKRSDPIYNAHAYLTKVPVTAIEPFIEAFTEPGDVVLDIYGGSGMTGVAAGMLGRRGEVRDISALGRHIGSN